jgi:hypothetical protein
MARALELAEAAIKENGQTSRAAIDGMKRAVELIAAAGKAPARDFVAPIGASCETAQIGASGAGVLAVDETMKQAILEPDQIEISELRAYTVLISELDMLAASCKAQIQGDEDADRRVPCEINDPAAKLANNPYAAAMKEQRWLKVVAKAQIGDGDIVKLYISDADQS